MKIFVLTKSGNSDIHLTKKLQLLKSSVVQTIDDEFCIHMNSNYLISNYFKM